MRGYDRVVLFKNAVETLGYFSEQIAIELEQQGIETYFIDYDNLYQTLEELPHFLKKGSAALLTFNFIGLSGEEVFLTEEGVTIWEACEMRILNILVDHPMYYHDKLEKIWRNMKVFCIDREHVSYIGRFYQHVDCTFLPSAGNIRADMELSFLRDARAATSGVVYRDYEKIWDYEKNLLPLEKRKWDIVFTGNYVPTYFFEQRIGAQGKEYRDFYFGMIEDLLERPWQTMDAVLEAHIRAESGELSETDLRAVLGNLVFIDQWVRSEVRSRVISQLLEQDLKLYLVGADWDLFPCKKPWNMKCSGEMVSSVSCIEAIQNAKISLNVMPWFRDGTHDRIFTAMLQKTVSVTDESRYLREHFTDEKELLFYSLTETEALPQRLKRLLAHPEEMEAISEKGFEKASREYTWRENTNRILKLS